jgi:DNA polymerase-4
VTFETDKTDARELHRDLLRLSDAVGARLRRAEVTARTVVLKLRFEDFTTITRSRTLADPTDLGRRIYEEVRDLYDTANPAARPVRLIGVRGEQLSGEVAALGLWDEDEAWRAIETTVDAVGSKFGRDAIRPASLLRDQTARRYGSVDDPS